MGAVFDEPQRFTGRIGPAPSATAHLKQPTGAQDALSQSAEARRLFYRPTMTKLLFDGGPWDGEIKDRPIGDGVVDTAVIYVDDADAGYYQPASDRLPESSEAVFRAVWHPRKKS